MAEISATTIGRMRDVPSDSSRIELYNYNGSEDMTIGQLVVALSIRCCAIYERDSVVQMNLMNRGVENINWLSDCVNYVLSPNEENATWTGYYNYLTNIARANLSIGGVNLQQTIKSESDRSSVLKQIDFLIQNRSEYFDENKLQEIRSYVQSLDLSSYWSARRQVLIDRFGVDGNALPGDIGGYTNKMNVIEQLQQVLTKENSSVDRIAIEVETAINRRDSMYSMATKCVTHFGGSLMTAATNMVMR